MGPWHGAFISSSIRKGGRYIFLRLPLWQMLVSYTLVYVRIWLILSAPCLDVVLCWAADFQHLAIYVDREYYENTLLPVTLNITVAWGWSIFIINTLMTGGILYKIMLDNLVCVYVTFLTLSF